MFKVENYNLAKHTTFKIGGNADVVYIPETLDEFVEVLKTEPDAYVIGAGSNLIVSSFGLKRPVVLTKDLSSVKISGEYIEADAGVKTAMLSKRCLENSLSGMEFLCCIPASVGGVVMMNASAHKQVVSDIIVSATVFNLKTKEVEELSKEELNLDYRTSIIEGNYIVLSAKFKLQKADEGQIYEMMQANTAYRQKNHPPMKLPNAGSIFKNPQGEIAGRLVDNQNLKGVTVGGASVSDVHANFIVTNGDASSLDILLLMSDIKANVAENTGYNLQPEVKYIGDNTTENAIKEQELWAKLNN